MEDNKYQQSKMDYGEEESISAHLAKLEGEETSSNQRGGGQKGIIYKSMSEVLHESMIPYTESVVLDRALPRVEDGLKPVQRRILFSMLDLSVTPDKPHRKSARIVGDCLGKYHPHGDSSVYDAMCRMSQEWVLRAPLVDGHGNFGSVDGDSPAAMRYTEARLTPLAMELMRDLEKDTVRWSLNFDDTLKEPEMFPGRFPNLLVNGASGIAVGVATNIPPHNIGETIDGVVAYINNPNLKIEELTKIIKAPDFPSGGIIISKDDGLAQAYKTGKGKIVIRAKVGIEKQGDKTSLVITEIPYQVNKALLLQKIAEVKEANKEKLAGITEIRDESDSHGMRAVIRLKKDANPQKILEFLFKSTNLQMSFGINMVAIADGKPKLLNLLEIVSYYAQYQREIIVRRTKYDLNEAKERAHIVEGLLIAIKNIDEVIKIIKKSASVSEAKQKLKDKFTLSDKQVQAIMDMKLSRLVHLEVNKLEEELKDLKEKIAEYERILASKKAQFDIVKKELLEIKKAYNTPRKSSINGDDNIKLVDLDKVEDEPAKNYIFAISAGNTIKKVTTKNYSMSQKTIGENTTITDIPKQIKTLSSNDTVFIFTNYGNVIKLPAKDIKECKWRDKGLSLLAMDKNAGINEAPVAILSTLEKDAEIIFMTKQGMVKKTSAEDLVVSKPFYQVCKLADGDEVINVEVCKKGKSILMLTKLGMSLNFGQAEVPSQGRISGGVKGINLDEGDEVIFASQLDFSHVIIVAENGYIKKLATNQFPISPRYRKGLKYLNFAKNAKAVTYACSAEGETTLAVDFGLKILPLDTSKIPESERLTTGNEIIKKNFFTINKMI
ncbi:MAG: DNA topoisomerase 4 subunit A [Clostridia bacterium]|nr:DNA topoisomerase 4 subunit A [Clostridia bacterium]